MYLFFIEERDPEHDAACFVGVSRELSICVSRDEDICGAPRWAGVPLRFRLVGMRGLHLNRGRRVEAYADANSTCSPLSNRYE